MTVQAAPEAPFTPLVAPRRSAKYVALARQKTGIEIDIYDYINPVPWVVEAYIDFIRYMNAPYALSYHQAELCSLVVSYDHSCRYCHGASRTFLKIAGMHDEQIRRLEQDAHGSNLSAAEKRLLEVARRISRGTVSREDVTALLRDGFDRSEILELGLLVGGPACFGFRLATPLNYSLDGMIVKLQHPVVQLFRPVVSLALRWLANSKRQGPVPFPERNDGPFARIVEAYRPLPNAANLLRTIIDGAFASPVLSRTVKGLMVAVIARTVGDPVAETEAKELVLAEGMTDQELHHALAFLTCPSLSPAENRLLTYARDTVKYVPATLQDRTRELKAGLSDEALVEALGLCGLANGLVRMSLLVERM